MVSAALPLLAAWVHAFGGFQHRDDTVPCYDVVYQLAMYDRLLGENTEDDRKSRVDQKKYIPIVTTSAADFAAVFPNLAAGGNGFSCGYTQAWVAEVFESLEGVYPFWTAGAQGDNVSPNTASGYAEYRTADEVRGLFAQYQDSDDTQLFYIYHGGLADHVLLIEQVAGRRGYRVYQSYNSVYSLRAWLSDAQTLADLEPYWSEDASTGDIVRNENLAAVMNGALAALSAGAWSFENPPTSAELVSALGPVGAAFGAFLDVWSTQAVDKETIMQSLLDSKLKYGGGQVIPADQFMAGYVASFGELVEWYAEHGPAGHSAEIVTQRIFDIWTDLYGSPNPQVAPGAPFNLVAMLNAMLSGGSIDPDVRYFMQARVVTVPADRLAMCKANGDTIMESVKRAEGSTMPMRRAA